MKKWTSPSEKTLIIAAFAAIYLIWGGTYILNHWALASFPPFLLAGSRFLVAGLILGLFFLPSINSISHKQLFNASWVGILLLGIGTGAITYALQFVDTSLAALVVAFEPLIVVFFMWLILSQKPSFMALAGCLLGIIGIYVLVSQSSIITNEDTLFGISLITISLLSWAIGSVYITKLQLPAPKGLSAAVQMVASGLFLLLASAIFQEDPSQLAHNFEWRAIMAWTILVLFGSIITYSAFNYLLIKSTPDKVATTTYVNPIVALLLGWGLNNEHITNQSLAAAVILLAGVFFINLGKRKKRATSIVDK